ncbi:NAD(P)/FAD-dependent oxidoreductase [Nocardioides humilatus]|uniref:Pyridine nucleotide-disulfide oxidoreductase domain-containing protein 2 n=1 Tax=Nocardioides humilatus TaxID=2607660 RepID=A0A5B1LMJ3_9ACTN|nr:NAD(P)/FAD-dependent oxidoreductase [Nocardioides humilatus]KAA1421902.1 NAD(P)/FAD-dependent oxidoreductase [Nocardioides humilatus]
MAESYDFVVIGGGHNGLSAACTLGAAGASVLVVEQRPVLGGLSASNAYLPAAPQHVLSLGAMDDMFMSCTSIVDDLQLRRHGFQTITVPAPYGWIGPDGETLLLFADLDRTLAEVRRFSPHDARAYADLQPALSWIFRALVTVMSRHPAELPKRELGKHLLKLAPDRAIRRRLGQIMTSNLVELMAECFRSDAMRSLGTYWGSMIGPIDADGGGFYCVGLAAVHSRPGVQRPRGGMRSIVGSLESRARSLGVQVRTSCGVAEVVVEGGEASGVRLSDGTVVDARRGVLAAVPPQTAYGPLLAEGVLDSNVTTKVAMMPASGNNSATFKVDLAVGGRVSFPVAQARRDRLDGHDLRTVSLMTGTFGDQIEQLALIRQGRSLAAPPSYLAVLSGLDPTVAPPGQDVVYLASNVPAQPREDWADVRDRYAEGVLATAGTHLSGLDAEIGRVVTSPADFGAQYATPNGSYFHVDMTPLRLAMNRPAPGLGGYRSPVAGYFHAGAGSHPGGGVSGWPGRLAARTALTDR